MVKCEWCKSFEEGSEVDCHPGQVIPCNSIVRQNTKGRLVVASPDICKCEDATLRGLIVDKWGVSSISRNPSLINQDGKCRHFEDRRQEDRMKNRRGTDSCLNCALLNSDDNPCVKEEGVIYLATKCMNWKPMDPKLIKKLMEEGLKLPTSKELNSDFEKLRVKSLKPEERKICATCGFWGNPLSQKDRRDCFGVELNPYIKTAVVSTDRNGTCNRWTPKMIKGEDIRVGKVEFNG